MAKAQFLPGNTDVQIIDYDTDIEPEQKTDAENKIDAIASALKEDSTAYLNVHRRITQNSPEEFVANFDADKYDFGQLLSYLQENYGGGDYRVRLYAKGRIKANKLLQIAHKVKPSNAPQINPTGDAAQILNVVLQEMRNSQERMFATLQQKTESRSDLLKDMVMFKEIMGGSQTTQNPVESLKSMIELMGLMNGVMGVAEPKEKGFIDVLEKALPAFLAAPRLPRAQNAQPVRQYKPNPVEPLKTPELSPEEQELKQMLGVLVKGAARGGDPYTYSSMLVDQFDIALLRQIAETPQIVDMLASVDARVGEHAPWFLLLIEHVKAQLGMESDVSSEYDELTDENGEGNNTGKTDPEFPDNVNP